MVLQSLFDCPSFGGALTSGVIYTVELSYKPFLKYCHRRLSLH